MITGEFSVILFSRVVALNRFRPVTSFDPLSNGAERRGLSFCFGGIFHLSFQARGPNAVFHSAAMPVPIQHHPLGMMMVNST